MAEYYKKCKPISRDRYERMRRTAAELDPSEDDFFKRVAKAGQTRIDTAKQAWRDGWPQAEMPPLRDALIQDVVAARAARHARADEATESQRATDAEIKAEVRARIDAINAQAEEGQLVGTARRALAKMCSRVLANIEAFDVVNDAFNEKMVSLAEQIKVEKMTLRRARSVVDLNHRMIQTTTSLVQSIHDLIKAERLAVGEPTEIVDVKTSPTDAMSHDELVKRLRYELQALQKIERWDSDDGSPSTPN